MAASLPRNVNVSKHPCLRAKLSQLRAGTTKAKETRSLVHEITLILGTEALASGLQTESASGTVCSVLGSQSPDLTLF